MKNLKDKLISSNIVNKSYIKSYFFSFSILSLETILCTSLPYPIITSYPFIKLFFYIAVIIGQFLIYQSMWKIQKGNGQPDSLGKYYSMHLLLVNIKD